MTDEYDPKDNHFKHLYDENGRITDVFDPEGGHWKYARSKRLINPTAEGLRQTHCDPSVAG